MNHWRLLILLSLLPAMGSGCVALNLPSERYEEPAHEVGEPRSVDDFLFWAPQRGGHAADTPDAPLATEPAGAVCEERLPEVPWPRFHPVPTRPVY